MGTEKHQAPWTDGLVDFKDFGCFALTELGHGSNVKGIQTTAHYDPKTKEFAINTPVELATKIWIGGAA